MVFALALASLLPFLAPGASAQATNSTRYAISNINYPNLCVAPSGNVNGAGLIVTSCDTSSDIGWTFDGLSFHNTANSLCIDVTDGGAYNGNLAQVWGCYSWNRNQMYALSGENIKWAGQNFCLDLKDGKGVEGNPVQIWQCYNGNANQEWIFTEIEEVDDCDNETESSAHASSTYTASSASPSSAVDATSGSNSTVSEDGATSNSTAGGQLWAGAGSSASTRKHHSATASASASSASASDSSDWSDDSSASASAGASSTTGKHKASSTGSATTPSSTKATTSSGYLQVSGTAVVDPSGNKVMLRGINYGGWLVFEDWMCGISDSSGTADRFPQWTLEQRFGQDAALKLTETWMDAWSTSDDWDKIAAAGFNMVRLPFSYRNFQWADGSWMGGSSSSADFTRLDWAVQQAKQRGIYLIPTFHIWQGQKEGYSTISENSDDGQSQRDAAGEIWKVVAAHYAGESTIAAFDAINEPTGSYADKLQQDLYTAIRSADANRIIVMESIATDPKQYGWTNVIYSMHEYLMMGDDVGANQAEFYSGLSGDVNTYKGLGIPAYVGEFMTHTATLSWILDQLNQLDDVWWSPWTYKTVNMGGWGLYNTGGFSVDVGSDSQDSISRQWSNMGNLNQNSDIYSIYKAGAGGSSSQKRSVEPRDTEAPAPRAVRSERAEPVKRAKGHNRRSRGRHGRFFTSDLM